MVSGGSFIGSRGGKNAKRGLPGVLEIEKDGSKGSTLEKKDTTLEKKAAALDQFETTLAPKDIALG